MMSEFKKCCKCGAENPMFRMYFSDKKASLDALKELMGEEPKPHCAYCCLGCEECGHTTKPICVGPIGTSDDETIGRMFNDAIDNSINEWNNEQDVNEHAVD